MDCDITVDSSEEECDFPKEVTSEEEILFEVYEEATDNDYNINVSVAVVDAQSEEINADFAEALTEIEGKKSFPCPKCTKVCKSKGGLTKHTNSKHRDAATSATAIEPDMNESSLSEENLASIIETIKTKLVSDDLYSADLNAAIKKVSCSKDLFNDILPIYNMFRRKRNQDKLLEQFYGLLPANASKFLNCTEDNVANLIMIEIPDRLVGFFKISQSRENATKQTCSDADMEADTTLHPSERGPLSYIAGYIVSKLYQTSRSKQGTINEGLHALLQALKSDESANSFISVRSRRGLVTPCENLLGILEEAEICFRKNVGLAELTDTVRNIPIEVICVSTLNSPVVKSLWANIVLDSGIEQSGSTHKLCLENIIKLYLRVRSFSYARDYISKYKIKEKQTKKKALRKDLKRSKSE